MLTFDLRSHGIQHEGDNLDLIHEEVIYDFKGTVKEYPESDEVYLSVSKEGIIAYIYLENDIINIEPVGFYNKAPSDGQHILYSDQNVISEAPFDLQPSTKTCGAHELEPYSRDNSNAVNVHNNYVEKINRTVDVALYVHETYYLPFDANITRAMQKARWKLKTQIKSKLTKKFKDAYNVGNGLNSNLSFEVTGGNSRVYFLWNNTNVPGAHLSNRAHYTTPVDVNGFANAIPDYNDFKNWLSANSANYFNANVDVHAFIYRHNTISVGAAAINGISAPNNTTNYHNRSFSAASYGVDHALVSTIAHEFGHSLGSLHTNEFNGVSFAPTGLCSVGATWESHPRELMTQFPLKPANTKFFLCPRNMMNTANLYHHIN